MKFRRKSTEPDPVAGEATGGTEETAVVAGQQAEPDPASAEGPFDVDDFTDDGIQRVDLGSLLVAPEADRELRVQVDEQTRSVQSVLLAGPDGAIELRAFSAPRGGDLWSEVRPQLAADMSRRGGTATEREGRFGIELVCQLSVRRPDGSAGQQPSRIVGINGPRWMLRATFLGQPAVDPDAAAGWEETLTKVVVRRGSHAMPVGDPLPVVLPEQTRGAVPGNDA